MEKKKKKKTLRERNPYAYMLPTPRLDLLPTDSEEFQKKSPFGKFSPYSYILKGTEVLGELLDIEKEKDTKKKSTKKKSGGSLKDVPEDNVGLGKLPTPVRNKMGFKKQGGKVGKPLGCGQAERGFGKGPYKKRGT
jgi:hypothetical protein